MNCETCDWPINHEGECSNPGCERGINEDHDEQRPL